MYTEHLRVTKLDYKEIIKIDKYNHLNKIYESLNVFYFLKQYFYIHKFKLIINNLNFTQIINIYLSINRYKFVFNIFNLQQLFSSLPLGQSGNPSHT